MKRNILFGCIVGMLLLLIIGSVIYISVRPKYQVYSIENDMDETVSRADIDKVFKDVQSDNVIVYGPYIIIDEYLVFTIQGDGDIGSTTLEYTNIPTEDKEYIRRMLSDLEDTEVEE